MASHIKRRRATSDEMARRADFLVGYAKDHGPVTVRQLYYQAEVWGLPGIDKSDGSYAKIQRQVLSLRRSGAMEYHHIADATRWMRKPKSYGSVQEALQRTAKLYRKDLWRDANERVEIWVEKDALAGVIFQVTSAYDVPLMVTRGFSSETFCYEAIDAHPDPQHPYYIYYLGDFDRAGQDAARALEEKLRRFGEDDSINVVFEQLAVTESQIANWALPTRAPKRNSPADRNWLHKVAVELDAIPPDKLRHLVEAAINRHLPQDRLRILKIAEASERELFRSWIQDGADT